MGADLELLVWNESCQLTFQTLKDLSVSALVLSIPNLEIKGHQWLTRERMSKYKNPTVRYPRNNSKNCQTRNPTILISLPDKTCENANQTYMHIGDWTLKRYSHFKR